MQGVLADLADTRHDHASTARFVMPLDVCARIPASLHRLSLLLARRTATHRRTRCDTDRPASTHRRRRTQLLRIHRPQKRSTEIAQRIAAFLDQGRPARHIGVIVRSGRPYLPLSQVSVSPIPHSRIVPLCRAVIAPSRGAVCSSLDASRAERLRRRIATPACDHDSRRLCRSGQTRLRSSRTISALGLPEVDGEAPAAADPVAMLSASHSRHRQIVSTPRG